MTDTPLTHSDEIANRQRFAFGENWSRFLMVLDEDRILEAEKSLKAKLGVENLRQKTFIDIGSGSGLFSLAAKRLGAKVVSFDFDPQSVACTSELRRRYVNDDANWKVLQGSALDREFIKSLGKFDIVYSWGVLHHTGEMWKALGNVVEAVDKNGKLFISIYNDQGKTSKRWLLVKKTYVALPKPLRWLVTIPSYVWIWGPTILRDCLRLQPFKTWREYKAQRGMSPAVDVIDWIGGLPFEVAKPEEVFSFYAQRGFTLRVLKTCGGGKGCNEFVFDLNGVK